MTIQNVSILKKVEYNGKEASIGFVQEVRTGLFGKSKVKTLGYQYGIKECYSKVKTSEFYETEEEARREALKELLYLEHIGFGKVHEVQVSPTSPLANHFKRA